MAWHREERAPWAGRVAGLVGGTFVGALALVDAAALVWAVVDVTQHPDKVRRTRRQVAPLEAFVGPKAA